jgi:hypothetical protein
VIVKAVKTGEDFSSENGSIDQQLAFVEFGYVRCIMRSERDEIKRSFHRRAVTTDLTVMLDKTKAAGRVHTQPAR